VPTPAAASMKPRISIGLLVVYDSSDRVLATGTTDAAGSVLRQRPFVHKGASRIDEVERGGATAAAVLTDRRSVRRDACLTVGRLVDAGAECSQPYATPGSEIRAPGANELRILNGWLP